MRWLWFILIAFLCQVDARGQLIEPVILRLSTLEEFMSLFNGTPGNSDLFKIYPIVIKQERNRIIEGLCDVSYPLDEGLRKELNAFSTDMCLNQRVITEDMIKTFLTVHYKDRQGKDFPVMLTVRPKKEKTAAAASWIIEKVESPMFHIGDTARSSLSTPFDNEVGFAALLRPGTDYREKLGNDYTPDYRALYLYLTANGYLKLDYIAPYSYRIDIGDYTLFVSYRQRVGTSLAGWVITRLEKNKRIIFDSKS